MCHKIHSNVINETSKNNCLLHKEICKHTFVFLNPYKVCSLQTTEWTNVTINYREQLRKYFSLVQTSRFPFLNCNNKNTSRITPNSNQTSLKVSILFWNFSLYLKGLLEGKRRKLKFLCKFCVTCVGLHTYSTEKPQKYFYCILLHAYVFGLLDFRPLLIFPAWHTVLQKEKWWCYIKCYIHINKLSFNLISFQYFPCNPKKA